MISNRPAPGERGPRLRYPDTPVETPSFATNWLVRVQEAVSKSVEAEAITGGAFGFSEPRILACIMNHTQAAPLPAEAHRDRRFLERLMNPIVDRSIAVVAILPMLWSARYRYQHYGLNLPVIYYFLSTFVMVLTMLLRRPPKRILGSGS
jgi:hypothetical protein